MVITMTAIRKSRGQTFPEMMIVVAIIAILAAVIIANLFHARAQAQVSSIMSTEKQIANALEMYYNDYGMYPTLDGNGDFVTPTVFGGAGNKYYNGTPTTAQQPYVVNPGSTFSACWTSAPCNYSVDWNTTCTVDGGNVPSSITQWDGTPTVKGTMYMIVYQDTHGFFAAGADMAGC